MCCSVFLWYMGLVGLAITHTHIHSFILNQANQSAWREVPDNTFSGTCMLVF